MNKELLEDFIKFCNEHPELRFWQALKTWAKVDFIYVKKDGLTNYETVEDTFYWVNKNN